MLMAGIVYTAKAPREGGRRTKGYLWAAGAPGPEPPGGRGAAGRWDGRPRPAPGLTHPVPFGLLRCSAAAAAASSPARLAPLPRAAPAFKPPR